jgi:hypothetical protein
MKLPIFKNKSELENSIWSKYFIHIYGEIPDSDYPIDLNTFWILYTNILEKYNIVLTDKCVKDKNCYTICQNNEGSLYGNMSNVDDMKDTLWIYHKPPYKAFPDNSKIEVTHVSGGYPLQKSIESSGSWMYYAKGSGMYFNTGKTISFIDHSESVKHFLDIDISCPLREECVKYFSKIVDIAKNKGYDSIQYLKHYDMRCGDTAIEIIDLHGVGAFPCGNKTKLNIKSGWLGKNICICDNHKQSMNCKVKDNIIGGIDAYKSKSWTDSQKEKYWEHHEPTLYHYIISFIIYIILIYTLYKLIIRKNKIFKKHILLWTILLILFSMLIYLYLILYRFQ